jgi:regulator of protease activity HflC (stomatin/prohibitin superfamily)
VSYKCPDLGSKSDSVVAGEAEATVAIANAKATALQKVGETLKSTGDAAAALSVAEQYVKAFSELAKTNNTLILPADTGNVSATVAQVSFLFCLTRHVFDDCLKFSGDASI